MASLSVVRIAALVCFVFLLAGCMALSGCGVASNAGQQSAALQGASKLIVAYPPVQSVAGRRALTCISLMETDVTASRNASLTNGIEGKVTPGRNGVSLSFRDASTITFLSDAAAKAGAADGAAFKIIRNEGRELVAYFFDGRSMNSFVLNKASGLAIWSKIRSTFPVYDAPQGGSSYLVCR